MGLPPFVGETPTVRAAMSPFAASFSEFVLRFGYTEPRLSILRGLHTYRAELRAAGFQQGFQWLNGSFSEQIELSKDRPPGDIDIVTLCYRPAHLKETHQFALWCQANPHLMQSSLLKKRLKCEAFFLDMNKPAHILVDDVRYWNGLFSHQRETSLWKGMVQVPLLSDDDLATVFLG